MKRYNPDSFFPTPQEAITQLLEEHTNIFFAKILEPSAGNGAIIDELLKRSGEDVEITAIDVDFIRINELESKYKDEKRVRIIIKDFLEYKTDERYDYVFMNPPFSHGKKSVFREHIIKAFSFLRPNGKLYSVVPATWSNHASKSDSEFYEFCKENINWVENLPTMKYGTCKIKTSIISLTKPENDND